MGFWDKWRPTQPSDTAARAALSHTPPVSAERLVQLGLELEAQGRHDEALESYQTAVSLQPELAHAHFLRGNILLDRGEATAALEAYTTALRHKPDSAGAYCNLGNAHLQLSDPLRAVSAFDQALVVKPDLADAVAGLRAARDLAAEQAEGFFRQGLEAHEGGRLDEASRAYRQVLTLRPDHVEALNNLGGIRLQEADVEEAVVLLRRASEQAPHNAATLLNLGDALGFQRKWDAAVACYERALQLEPDNPNALARMGDGLLGLRQPDQAAAWYHRALELEPDHVDACLGLASVLIEGGQLDAAHAQCLRALAKEADSAKANNLLGAIAMKRLQFKAAILLFRKSLAKQPKLLAAQINLGLALQRSGEFDAAKTCFEQVLSIDSASAVAHFGLGAVFQQLGNYAAAEKSYLKALDLDASLVIAHSNLGVIYTHGRQFGPAAECFGRALALDPRFAAAHANLAGMLKDLGRLDESLRSLRKALEIDSASEVAHNNLLFIQNYLAEQPAHQLLDDARRFGEVAASLARPYTSWPNTPDSRRPLRVGLVSGDLGNHPVGYFLDGVLAAFASQATRGLSFHAYSNRLNEDETSRRLRACCDSWCCCTGMSDEALARRVRDDGIDILIDLAGHTANNRLTVFAWKPAPIQASWLGYFATTGVSAMDYFVADPWTLPPEQEPFFTEQVWRLPETRLCFTPPDSKVEVNALPASAVGYVTFGCFNNLSKMNNAVVQLWARVLNAVPGSRLFLKSGQLADGSVCRRTSERFASHGVGAERLIFEGQSERTDYLAAYHRVDIALDPFPFPGGTTTVEALWMGVPVLTLEGERFLARQGVGLLMNAGLADWIAADAEDYVARAANHAGNLLALAALRARLREQALASPIYDAPRFARSFEQALRTMWARWCATQGT